MTDLAFVLNQVVLSDGRLKPAAMSAVRARLDMQLARLAVTGPETTPDLFPTDQARWAYWFNARAAWSIKLADLAGWPAALPPERLDRPFKLDGKATTLAAIDRLLESQSRAHNEFRLLAATPGVYLDNAPMPARPFTADAFPAEMESQLAALLRDRRRTVINIEAREIRLPQQVWRVRDVLAGQYARISGPTSQAGLGSMLLPFADAAGRRRLQDAVGYAVVPQPPRPELAVPRPAVFSPGNIGRVEPGDLSE